MNGKIIGTNLQVMLHYFKEFLGKDVKIIGISLIIIGGFLLLSISFSIFFKVIINMNFINHSLPIKINRPVINVQTSSSSRQNQYQTTFSQNSFETEPRKPKSIYKLEKPKDPRFTDKNFGEATEFLIKGCKLSFNIFDSKWNCNSGWRHGSKSGPKGYLKDYYPPDGWTGIGLKVASLYDKGDNAWLGNNNSDGEWYIAYHGVKTVEAIKGICDDGFRRGDGQAHRDGNNINPLNNNKYPKCGEGVYFTNEINEAKKYTKPIKYKGKDYIIVFMCRVNPYHVKIADIGGNKEYWVVNGDKLGDLYGYKRSNEVRPYRILVLKT